MNKEKIVKELIMVFWIFIIGSIIGYIFEMIVALFQNGHFESRQGIIYGPFTPVYGAGAVIYYLILNHMNVKSKFKVFLVTAVLGGIVEYMCSLLQEKIFGTISWDYSSLMFNLHGRTSLLHCTYWGIAGVIYIVYLDPFLEDLKEKINQNKLKAITVLFAFFMIFNISISCVAANRQLERRNNIPASSTLDEFLDKHYPDSYMDKIFANKKEVFQKK